MSTLFPSLTVFVTFLSIWCSAASKECTKDDLKYAYTECNDNTRWRVQIPRSNCQGGSVEFPKPGMKCNRTCSPGTFLEISSDSCKPCPAGQYSLGSGARFDNWQALPPGFQVTRESGENSNCDSAQWKPMGDFVAGKPVSGCLLSLLYSVQLSAPGYVSFEYQSAGSDALFAFDVQNERCENMPTQSGSPWLNETQRGEIGTHRVSLQPGTNVLRWTVTTMWSHGRVSNPALLYSVQVTGLPFVRSCSSCPAGWHSAAGRSTCSRCQRDEFSGAGAASCQPCPPDQFAPPASANCSKRPPCSEADAELYYTECTRQSEFSSQLARRWVRPRVCQPPPVTEAAPGGGESRSCARFCNPGMRSVAGADGGLACDACPRSQFSADTSGVCSPCPPGTQVLQEYVVTNWAVVPPMMNLSCVTLRPDSEAVCDGNGWKLMLDHVETVAMRHFAHRLLRLQLPGFVSPTSDLYGSEQLRSQLTVEFETVCKAACRLSLVQQDKHNQRGRYVNFWDGSVKRQNFSLQIHSKEPVKFYLVFDTQVSDEPEVRKKAMHDHVKVFSIRATNVKGSGGVKCQHCPMEMRDKKCVPCMPGKYYESSNNSCVRCPTNTTLSQPFAVGRNACAPCPPGLRSGDGVFCRVDDKPVDAAGKHFYLSQLLTAGHNATGAKMFASVGVGYVHVYNVSLDVDTPAVCVSNATTAGAKELHALVCRSTLVPSLHGHPPLSALPTSLGDRLLNASRGDEAPQMSRLLAAGGWRPDRDGHDTHVFFGSDDSTDACPGGRGSVVTLRCDPDAGSARLLLPPKCPDATCDGCLFHFMLLSQAACPMCLLSDYDTVLGECAMGEQIVHRIPPKHCYLSKEQPKQLSKKKKCPLVSLPVLAALCTAAAVGLASVLLACHCYRKNKTLQYKYMQLVEAQEGDMPAAESCAVHEGEEDDEEVTVKGGKAVFSKLRRTMLPSGESRRKGGEQQLSLTEQMEDMEL